MRKGAASSCFDGEGNDEGFASKVPGEESLQGPADAIFGVVEVGDLALAPVVGGDIGGGVVQDLFGVGAEKAPLGDLDPAAEAQVFVDGKGDKGDAQLAHEAAGLELALFDLLLAIDVFAADGHRGDFGEFAVSVFRDAAVFDDEGFVDAHLLGQLRVANEVVVGSVHRQKGLGPEQLHEATLFVPAGVTADMHARRLAATDDLHALALEGVAHFEDGPLAARDDPRGENHPIAGIQGEVAVVVPGEAGQRSGAFSLGAGRDDEQAIPGELLGLLGGNDHAIDAFEKAELPGDTSMVFDGTTEEQHPAVALFGGFEGCPHAVDVRGKEGDDNPVWGFEHQRRDGVEYVAFFAGHAFGIDVGRVAQEQIDTFVADFPESVAVEVAPVDGVLLDLEVPGMHQGARRGSEDQTGAVGNAVVDPVGLDFKGADGEALPGLRRAQVEVPEVELPKAPLDELQGVGRAINRDGFGGTAGVVEFPKQVGDGADVVFVAVGDENGNEALRGLRQVIEAGMIQVNAVDPAGKGDATIDDDALFPELDGHAVHPHLAETAEGNDPKWMSQSPGSLARRGRGPQWRASSGAHFPLSPPGNSFRMMFPVGGWQAASRPRFALPPPLRVDRCKYGVLRPSRFALYRGKPFSGQEMRPFLLSIVIALAGFAPMAFAQSDAPDATEDSSAEAGEATGDEESEYDEDEYDEYDDEEYEDEGDEPQLRAPSLEMPDVGTSEEEEEGAEEAYEEEEAEEGGESSEDAWGEDEEDTDPSSLMEQARPATADPTNTDWAEPELGLDLHGYFRVRGEVWDNFFLSRPTGTGRSYAPFDRFRPAQSGVTPAGGCGDEPNVTDPSACGGDRLAFANMRLRLEPTLSLSDDVRIHTTIDIFDNLVMGSTPDGLAYTPPGVGGNTGDGFSRPARTPGVPLDTFSATQNPPQGLRNSVRDSIYVRRAWAEVTNRSLGQLRFGRMPSHWGLGMLANRGDGIDSDFSSDVDRVMAITKIAGFHIVAAYDFAAQGIQRDLVTDLRGVPYDASNEDDVRQFVFAVAHRAEEEEAQLRLQQGDWVLEGGLYFVYRNQFLSSAGASNAFPGSGDYDTAFVRRNAQAFIPDAWARFRWGSLRLETELAFIIGDVENIENDSFVQDDYNILQFGWAFEGEYRLLDDKLAIRLAAGYASGDQDINGLSAEQGLLAQQTDNRTLSHFQFHPNYRIDLILWRNIMGRVAGTWYAKPGIGYDIIRNPFGQLLGARFDVVYSHAAQAVQTYGGDAPLGVELDFSLYYRSEDGPGIMDGFFLQAQYGILFPLAGLGYRTFEGLPEEPDPSNMSQNRSVSRAQAMRMILGVNF